MKILMVLSSASFSGAENVVCQIIGMFDKYKNYEFVYSSCDGPIRVALKERGVVFAPMSDINTKELKRVIKECKPDIIHAHDMRASFVASLVCGKIPLVSHIHNNAFDSRKITVKSIAYLYAAKRARRIFWVSQSSYEGYFFQKYLTQKSIVLNNILDADALRRKADTDPNDYDYDVIYIGRLTYPKNPKRLIEVLSGVVKKNPTIRIAIIGTGDMESETKQWAEESHLKNNLSFLGFKTNPYKVLSCAKVMVMTSLWEGTPMVSLEAMALGIPIVSTPVDGLKALIENDKNGYLSNSNEELIAHICSVVDDVKKQKRLSEGQLTKSKSINNIEEYRSKIADAYRA